MKGYDVDDDLTNGGDLGTRFFETVDMCGLEFFLLVFIVMLVIRVPPFFLFFFTSKSQELEEVYIKMGGMKMQEVCFEEMGGENRFYSREVIGKRGGQREAMGGD